MNDCQIITGSKDRSVKLYDYQKHNCIKTFFTSSGVLDIKNSYKTIYCGNLDGKLRVFNNNSSWSTFDEKIFSHDNNNFKINKRLFIEHCHKFKRRYIIIILNRFSFKDF